LNAGFDQGLIQSSVTATQYRLTGLSAQTTYYFRVRAFNGNLLPTDLSAATQTVTSQGGLIDELVSRADSHTYATLLNSQRSVSLTLPASIFTDQARLLVQDSTVTPCGTIPAAVSITVTPKQQPDKSGLLLTRYDEDSGRCVPLKSQSDPSNLKITAVVDHLSLYQVQLSTPAASLADAVIWPNPLRPKRAGQGFVTIKPLPPDATVEIFTLRGELVYRTQADASGTAQWLAVNRKGTPAASGVYLVFLKSGGSNRILKVAIER